MKSVHTIRIACFAMISAHAVALAPAFAEEAKFRALGFLNPSQAWSSAWDVSDDGKVVALSSWTTGYRGALWTENGLVELPPLAGTHTSSAGFTSADGSVIVGRSVIGCCTTRSTRWTASNGWHPEYLGPNLGGGDFLGTDHNDHALGISGDGMVVVGQSATGLGDAGAYHPYRWTEEVGMESLVAPQNASTTFGAAGAASYDGQYIAGWYRPLGSGSQHAFRWSQEEGLVFLGMLGNFGSEARAITPDGSIVVGDSHTMPIGRTAFRWTMEGGMENLGQWMHEGELKNTVPRAVSGDGSILVGYGMIFFGTCPQCFWHHEATIWDAENGWRHLKAALADDYGLELFGWVLNEARAISPDGRFIVGEGTNPLGQTEGWLVELPKSPTPPTCPGDLTGSGSVGVPDLLQLLSCWGADEPGGACANSDLTESGSVGVPDLLQLLSFWGPCP